MSAGWIPLDGLLSRTLARAVPSASIQPLPGHLDPEGRPGAIATHARFRADPCGKTTKPPDLSLAPNRAQADTARDRCYRFARLSLSSSNLWCTLPPVCRSGCPSFVVGLGADWTPGGPRHANDTKTGRGRCLCRGFGSKHLESPGIREFGVGDPGNRPPKLCTTTPSSPKETCPGHLMRVFGRSRRLQLGYAQLIAWHVSCGSSTSARLSDRSPA